MLYHFFYSLAEDISAFNVFKYISFRSVGAAVTALLASLLVGPWFIRKLRAMSLQQVVRQEGPATHYKKKDTPTMGGGMILFALTLSVLLWSDLSNPAIWIVLFLTLSYGILGWMDDYLKIVKGNTSGVSGKRKLGFQVVVASVTVWLLVHYMGIGETLHFPFFKDISLDLGWLFYPFCVLVIVGSSNAVNLTDGLDGLATGSLVISLATLMALTYLAGHVEFASYLDIPYVPGTGELSIFCAAALAAGLGFLWYNAYPAQVFMGDVGSLSLGGAMGTLAIATRNEMLLPIIGGIFVIETVSVIIQVLVFKRTGKRVFRMAPIHHHYEMMGIAESKITVRGWIISVLLAIVALSTLKLR